MTKYLLLTVIFFLSGCGADVATTTATIAKAKAQEAKEAQKTKEHLTQQINAAMAASQKRLHDADQAAQ